MYIVHWLNDKNNLSYYKFYNFISFDFVPGYENNNGHIIISIYYFDNNTKTLYSQEEKELLFRIKPITIKTKIINHLIDFLYKIR